MIKNHIPKIIEIDEKAWRTLMQVTLGGIKTILSCAKILLEINEKENMQVLIEHPYVSAGLVTYAVEEYGKLLILQTLEPKNGKIEIEYKKLFRTHKVKFEAAHANLPTKSKTIGKGIFDPAIFDPRIFDTKAPEPSFEARTAIFYSDIDENGEIRMMPYVHAKQLRKAIESFEKIIKKIKLE